MSMDRKNGVNLDLKKVSTAELLSEIIAQIKDSEDIPFNLLELADPSRKQIDEYLASGTCYVAKFASKVIGVMILDQIKSFVYNLHSLFSENPLF